MINRKAVLTLLAVMGSVLVMLSLGCTKKDNLTGDNWSGIAPRIALADSFTMGYSYTHTGKVTGSETYLLCGSEEGIEAVAVMRWTGLYDSMTVVAQPVLRLIATRRSPLSRNPLILSFHKLSANWAADSTDLISDTDITPLAIPDLTVADSISTLGDTLSIDISEEIIEDWETEDVTGFNLVLKANTGSWMEFKSSGLSGYGPLLTFKYKVPSDTTTYTYSQRAILDSYRVTGTQADIVNNTWKLKNLKPQRMFFRFTLPDNIFTDMDGEVLSAQDRHRMTINKAELILFVKDNPYYANTTAYFFPYNVKPDTLTSETVLTDSQLETLTYTYASGTIVNKDSVRVEITPIIQAFTSGDKPNNGIVVSCTSEMHNFGKLEFWHYADAPEGKKPYIRIYYTEPYLK